MDSTQRYAVVGAVVEKSEPNGGLNRDKWRKWRKGRKVRESCGGGIALRVQGRGAVVA
jgi:hypothetical protein